MRDNRLFAAQLATAAAVIVSCGMSAPASAQTAAATAAPPIKPLPLQLKCNPNPLLPTPGAFSDPFKGKLAGPELPPGNIPVERPGQSQHPEF